MQEHSPYPKQGQKQTYFQQYDNYYKFQTNYTYQD
jgi:hypothetical protein